MWNKQPQKLGVNKNLEQQPLLIVELYNPVKLELLKDVLDQKCSILCFNGGLQRLFQLNRELYLEQTLSDLVVICMFRDF